MTNDGIWGLDVEGGGQVTEVAWKIMHPEELPGTEVKPTEVLQVLLVLLRIEKKRSRSWCSAC